MKLLTLIRHAKADSPLNCRDFDRPLSPRGEADVPLVAGRYEVKPPPEQVIASSALRARTTAELFIRTCGYPADTLMAAEWLYHASSSELISWLQQQDDAIRHLALVGHNPTIADACTVLTGQPARFSPCTIVTLEFAFDRWNSIAGPCGKVIFQDSTENN